MLPYLVFFGLFALGSLMTRPDLRSYKPVGPLLIAGAILVAVMIGLRDRVGVDWANYLQIWAAAGRLSLGRLISAYGSDPAFYALTWVMRGAGLPFWMLNLLCAAIFTWGLFAFARMMPNPWLAVAAAIPYLVIVVAMSGVRQATAIGFLFLALRAFRRLRTGAFLGWVAAAAAFHASAILVVPFAGLSLARSRFQSLVLLTVTLIAGYFLLGSSFDQYAGDYLSGRSVESSGAIFRVAMSALAAALFFTFYRQLPLDEHERILWRNFALLALASVPLLMIVPSTTALDRMLLYIYPLQLLAFASAPLMLAPNNRGHQILLTLMILAYHLAIMLVFFGFAVNRAPYLPYRNYLF